MADVGINSAAVMAANITPAQAEVISMPGFGGGMSNPDFDPKKYRVRYGKFCITDPESVAELEDIETRGLLGVDIVILSKDKYVFMDQYFMVVLYLEKN